MADSINASGKKAVVLFSGGLDSSTVLKIAVDEGFEVVPLSFFYNQRHKVELEHAKKIADRFGLKSHVIINLDFSPIKGSALTDAGIEVPKNRINAENPHETAEDIPATYVPARNTIFLSYALALAEVTLAGDIFIGVNHLDYSGYPDCRPEFIAAYEDMANLATKASVTGKLRYKINTPLINMGKKEIILKAFSINVPLELTHSCYDPVDGLACGLCDSCVLRKKGFGEAGIKDPTRYYKS